MTNVIRIATRSSRLALWQAEYIRSLLEAAGGVVEIIHIRTEGDRNQSDPLRQFGGTGLFTREVQRAVLDSAADVAVHSLKDLPTQSADGLTLAAVPDRAATADVLLLPHGQSPLDSLDQLPKGSRVGTGSPRRQAQLLHHRPDLQTLEIRGNVETRIRKLDEGEFDAIVLAEAGLNRLELSDRISFRLTPPLVYPAVGQGAIGVECRADDEATQRLLARITNPSVLASVTAERSLLAALRAGCHAPLGAATSLKEDRLTLTGVLLSTDGKERLEATLTDDVSNAFETGQAVASQLISLGGSKLVDAF